VNQRLVLLAYVIAAFLTEVSIESYCHGGWGVGGGGGGGVIPCALVCGYQRLGHNAVAISSVRSSCTLNMQAAGFPENI